MIIKNLDEEGKEKKGVVTLRYVEYIEKHSVSKLIDPPPGNVVYEGEGQLTGKLYRKPFNIVLLDDIKKVNLEILDLYLKIFENNIVQI